MMVANSIPSLRLTFIFGALERVVYPFVYAICIDASTAPRDRKVKGNNKSKSRARYCARTEKVNARVPFNSRSGIRCDVNCDAGYS